ncbi:hypothetical protein FS837_005160 [Tulasnella sp. UAMH 9824]|nr:hypothetical protein FS837_005160 [Tulasnella sp. UAMH 9824]
MSLLSKVAPMTWVPLECCEVVEGQYYRNTLSEDQTRRLIAFSRLIPDVRLQTIRNGLQALGYSQSPYLQELGMKVDPNPMTLAGRILPTPTLACGENSAIQPRNGRWNMQGKNVYEPAIVQGCAIIIYDGRFGEEAERHLKQSLFRTSHMLGILGMPADPPVLRRSATGEAYWNHLREVGLMHQRAKGNMPNLIIVVLPDSGPRDLYVRIKNAGDIKIGVATQCLKAGRCVTVSEEYYLNVCLKINAKLGGTNFVLNPETFPLLTDPTVPSIVMGAHVVHPDPSESFRPSYAAVVGDEEIPHIYGESRRIELLVPFQD